MLRLAVTKRTDMLRLTVTKDLKNSDFNKKIKGKKKKILI